MTITVPAIIVFLVFLVNIGVSIFISRNHNNEKHKMAFALLMFLVAIWNLLVVMAQIVTDQASIIYFTKVQLLPIIFIPSVTLYFTYYFPRKRAIGIIAKFFLIAPVVVELIMFFTKYSQVQFHDEIKYVQYEINFLIIFFLVHFFIISAWSFVNLVRNYLQAESYIPKVQIMYIWLGTIPLSFLSILFSIILPFFDIHDYVIYSAPASVLFGLSILYAITRFRFMDIRVMVRRGVVYGVLLGLLIVIGLLFLAIFDYLLVSNFNLDNNTVLIISIIVFLIIFPKAGSSLKVKIDKIFHTESLDLSVRMQEFTHSIDHAHKLNQLLSQTADFITTKIQTKDVKFLIRDFRSSELNYICQYPKDCKCENISVIEISDYFKRIRLAVKEELPYVAKIRDVDKALIKKVKIFLDRGNLQMIIALKHDNEINGFMLLSKKVNKQSYSKSDVEFVKDVIEHLGGALDRVLYYEGEVERVRREVREEK